LVPRGRAGHGPRRIAGFANRLQDKKLMSMDGMTCRLLCNGCRRVVHVALMYWFPAIVAQGPPSERQL